MNSGIFKDVNSHPQFRQHPGRTNESLVCPADLANAQTAAAIWLNYAAITSTRARQPECVTKRALLHREAPAKPFKLSEYFLRGLQLPARHPSVRDNAIKSEYH